MHDEPVIRRTVVKHEVPSRFLPEGRRNIRVFLPPGYQETVSYPVVYCQDGEEFFNFGRIATLSQKLILEDDWEPYIVVGVDVDKKLRTSEYTPGGSRHEVYTHFFAEELLSYTETHFSVRGSPQSRLLAGDSLGGSACLSLSVARPDLFTRVLSLSGAYNEACKDQIRHTGDLSHLAIWMIVGLQETAFESSWGTCDMVALNRQMKKMLEERGAKVSYSEKDGEHKWGFWQQQLPAGLSVFVGPSPLY